MCSKVRTQKNSKLVGYTYPVLHQGKKWYVDFYAVDPVTKKMKRRKTFIPDDLKVAEKKRRAAEIIEVITMKLMRGWNPFVTTGEGTRPFIKFDDCVERYLS